MVKEGIAMPLSVPVKSSINYGDDAENQHLKQRFNQNNINYNLKY